MQGGPLPRPSEPAFWEDAGLEAELDRVFDICHGCRRCWNLCPSFETLFKRIDEIDDLNAVAGRSPAGAPAPVPDYSVPKPEGHHAAPSDPSLLTAQNPIEGLTQADRDRVEGECYQCKLCFNHCPYHPPHRFMLDFPRLMTRAKAQRRRRDGAPLFDLVAARVDLVGTLSSWAAPIANWMNGFPPFRALLEKTLGVDRRRNLPLFHFETFRRWWDRRGPKARSAGPLPMGGGGGTAGPRSNGPRTSGETPGPARRVALFYTCSVDYNEPQVGRAAVRVLEKNGFEVICPEQACCGMPHMDAGDMTSAEAAARRNVARFLPYALSGTPIVALGPTCSYMLKEEYPFLLNDEAARKVAAMTFDTAEFLMKLKKEGRLSEDFTPDPRPMAYHLPCHLKAQNIGTKSRDLLELATGGKVRMIDRCSAHDGTWAMKKEFYDLSFKAGRKLFEEVPREAGARLAGDCPLAGLQIQQGTGVVQKHPIEYVAEAYGCPDD